jgi:protein involved in polysaccharide export with SLBB domain
MNLPQSNRLYAISCYILGCMVLFGLPNLLPVHAAPAEDRSPVRDEVSNYKLGTGDHIRIQVFNEEDLTVEAELTDAGTVTYPFLGEIKVAGMTIGQLADYITRRLKGPYLVDPKVSVSVMEYREFFIYGEVGKPGNYPYQPGLTVQRAVAIAGGFTERASRRSITVEREDDPTHTPQYVEITDPVQPGDIVTVEESFF